MDSYQKETELTEEDYENILTEMFSRVDICGIKYDAGYALRMIDPIAFRCGKSDEESQIDENNPMWVCDNCIEEYEDEEKAEACCKEEL